MPLNRLVFQVIIGIFLCIQPAGIKSADSAPAPESQDEVSQEVEEAKTTIVEFYTWVGILPNELLDLKATLEKDTTVTAIEGQLPELAADVRDLQWETTMAKTSPDLQLLQIDAFQVRLYRIRGQVEKHIKNLTNLLSELSASRNTWAKKAQTLGDFNEQPDLAMALAIEQYDTLKQSIKEALEEIELRIAPALILGKQLANQQVKLHGIETDLKNLDREIRKNSTQQTSPSILSADFYKRVNLRLFNQTYLALEQFYTKHYSSLKENGQPFFLGALLVVVLSFMIYMTKGFIPPSSRWYPFASCPLATALFILTTIYGFISMLPIDLKLPHSWEDIFSILSLLFLIRLIRHIISEKIKRQLFSRLVFFMAFTHLLIVTEVPQLLLLFFVFYASLVAFLLYFYQRRRPSQDGWENWVRKSWGVIPAVIIVLGITGFDQLAVNVFATLLSTVGACLIVWMLYQLNSGLLELLLRVLPFSLLRDNLAMITQSLQPITAWFHGLLLIAVLGVIWNFFPTVTKAFVAISDLGFDVGSLHISPGFVLIVAFVFYGALLFSRALQTLLMREVFPRYKAEKGVQLSIVRLVHYAVLTIGFFIMLKVLGFDLQQLTLLGGALGVGIGFGLQAIVNNFASGIILLFERPIKVGDTIQVGQDLGEVKELGLRATIIQTFDNAEIVVPNSDLVTGQVTNWTLAERRVRIRVPVGVAYGSDIQKVIEILKDCADTNPMVLATPTPRALFLAFGASSLDFELRVWIPEFLEKTQVLSDLNVSIESEFELNNIEVPFPQTDLHLRSVDEKAAVALSGQCQDGQPGKSDLKPSSQKEE